MSCVQRPFHSKIQLKQVTQCLTKSHSQKYIHAYSVSNKEENYRILYILKQRIPGGPSDEGYASFKQVRPWTWHVEVILGVSVVGLVTKTSCVR